MCVCVRNHWAPGRVAFRLKAAPVKIRIFILYHIVKFLADEILADCSQNCKSATINSPPNFPAIRYVPGQFLLIRVVKWDGLASQTILCSLPAQTILANEIAAWSRAYQNHTRNS